MGFSKEDILTLAKAGFTADQISALNVVQAAPAPEPAPEPIPEPAPEPTPEPAPEPVPAPKQGATIDDVLAGITALNQNMQHAMLQNSSQPDGGQPETAEAILAQIINPSKPQGGN